MAERRGRPPINRTLTGKETIAVAALLNMDQTEIDRAAKTLIDMKSFVDADINTSIDEAGLPTEGGGRSKRGGAIKTATKLKEAVRNVLGEGKVIAKDIDGKIAGLIGRLPSLQQFLTGLLVSQGIRNPWFFTSLVRMIRYTLPSLIPAGDYTSIMNEAKDIFYESLGLAKDQVGYITTSPVYAVMLSVLLVRYLAAQKEQTPFQYLGEQARYTISVLGMAFTSVIDVVKDGYATSQTPAEQQKNTMANFREAVGKVARSNVIYEGAQPVRDAPGLMKQVPPPTEMAAKSAKELAEELVLLSRIVKSVPEKEAAELLVSFADAPAAAPTAAPTAAPPDETMAGGSRRRPRKTKKRATKKRRVTRRNMPTFSY